jgi:hypothetical protein
MKSSISEKELAVLRPDRGQIFAFAKLLSGIRRCLPGAAWTAKLS